MTKHRGFYGSVKEVAEEQWPLHVPEVDALLVVTSILSFSEIELGTVTALVCNSF